MIEYYDRAGNPLTLREWAALIEKRHYQRVAFTKVGEGVEVSTVWLGLNHRFVTTGPPLIFETMVFVTLEEPEVAFGRTMDKAGTEVYRWSSEGQALAGHDQVVAELRSQFEVGSEPA